MNYSIFNQRAVDKGFECPNRLFVVAHYLDSYEHVLNNCSEEESIWKGIYEYHCNGRTYYVLDESDACRVVDSYREMLTIQMEPQATDKPSVFIRDLAEAYYHDVFDVFDTIQEVELEIDNVIFPKYYIVEC
jgi:hypothetical protein